MLRAGNTTIEDLGFAVSKERIGGRDRQAIVIELPGSIDEEALEALCTGPIEVLDENGETVETVTGPFGVLSHGLKLCRSSAEADVAALTERVTTLEAELTEERNAKESAQSALASVKERLSALQASSDTAVLTGGTGAALETEDKAVVRDGADSV